MADYAVAHLDEIDEISDGREPWRPIRHHFGISSFGINAWTAAAAGDRVINEHDESDDGKEELYVVTSGRAVFELDGERREAPAGTFVYVRPSVSERRSPRSPGRRSSRSAVCRKRRTSRTDGRSGPRSDRSTRRVTTR